ncbi:hypothetical protein [Nitrosopumilus sp.]|uniref:hypothetical protein n=1 Tax=Nitrosopumilus sp. TaxID=2024843 RepID=UPI003D0BDAFD
MKNEIAVGIFVLVFGLFFSIPTHAEVDSFSEISFLQTGVINTSENQFQISNEIQTREFSNGNIIRVSGQTIEGFPYITYSKILEDSIHTHGIIYVGGKFITLSFEEKPTQKTIIEKKDDLQILVQYTQRVYSKQTAILDIKVYDPEQNKLNDYNLNYGFLANTNIEVIVLNENNEEFYSTTGITNDEGLFGVNFSIPEKYPQETMIITIKADDEDSESSRILQMFTLGDTSPKG